MSVIFIDVNYGYQDFSLHPFVILEVLNVKVYTTLAKADWDDVQIYTLLKLYTLKNNSLNDGHISYVCINTLTKGLTLTAMQHTAFVKLTN